MPDFIAAHHGSIIGLLPMTPEAKAWTDEHIGEDAQWLGRQLCIEPRYFADIADGIVADGLTITD